MKTGVEKIIQAKGGDAPAKNQTGVQKIIELLGGDPPAKNQTGVDKIVEILENGGGGGNPNRVETITGTAANPWGDVDFNTFYNALRNNEANAYITLDVTALGYPTSITVYSNSAWDTGKIKWTMFTTANIQGVADDSAIYCSFGMDYVDEEPAYFIGAWLGGEVTIMNDYAPLVPTTLTIIWHPLPDQS